MVSIDQFDQFVRKFPTSNVLFKCGLYSLDLFNKNLVFQNYTVGVEGKQTITQWGLFLIANRSILKSNDGRGSGLTDRDFISLNSLAGSLSDPITKERNATSFLQRIAQEQFPAQESNSVNVLARYYLIFDNSDLGNKFLAIHGISIENYMLIGMSIFGLLLTNKSPIIDFQNMKIQTTNQKILQIFTDNNKNCFKKLAFADHLTFRALSQVSLAIPGYEKYEFNALYSRPIIICDERFSAWKGKSIVPNIKLIINKITGGIYWDLRDHFRKQDSQEFLNEFGNHFKDYVGKILVNYFGKDNVKDLDICKEKMSIKGKIADWYVELEDIEIIIECKSSLMKQIVKQTFIPEMFQDWCRKSKFSSAVDQLLETDKLLPKTRKKRYRVIVILEDLYLLEVPDVKKMLDNRINDFYVMRVAELENMENWIKKYGIKRIFEEKETVDKNNNSADGREFFQICHRVDNKIVSRNSFLEKVYNDVLRF